MVVIGRGVIVDLELKARLIARMATLPTAFRDSFYVAQVLAGDVTKLTGPAKEAYVQIMREAVEAPTAEGAPD